MRSITGEQVAAFRMERHHLVNTVGSTLASVCRDVGGIQAQVMSSAELSLWTRRRSTSREDVQAALWRRRELVKTTSMRMTLHLLPANDFHMYIAAMKASSMASVHRTLKRIGAGPKHVDTMIAVVMDALADGPRTQQDLLVRAKARAARGMRVWLKYAWSAMRPAIVEGLICYGPPRGAQATFVRVDQWLPAAEGRRRRRGARRACDAFSEGVRPGDAPRFLEVGRAEHERDEGRVRAAGRPRGTRQR